ncbi:uncharacterized protein KQ657_003381 [Scheffersomyces spartinae]|uniref:Thiamine pyrophosphokinase n=1 Tax=Scheffersomyces spartinae TaxID=45513 RepID=A0A9P7VD03_9ASCO|nr:uncharacterized protein KQ657_003381 [Scheffersomyces spartinae]KAG7195614.1 hypothetical protein KQ657_003381 [Scheffersomyces spartinae]
MSVTVQDDDMDIKIPNDVNVISPFSVFSPSVEDPTARALIVLNQSLKNVPRFLTVWQGCLIHVCADGGANRLYDYFDSEEERKQYIPLYIVGDLDSLHKSVREYYERHGTRVIEQATQFATDYMKALMLVQLQLYNPTIIKGPIDTHDEIEVLYQKHIVKNLTVAPKLNLYVFGGIGGRFDQTVHSISQLYKTHEIHPSIQQFHITKSEMIFLLPEGSNAVIYSNKTAFNSRDRVPICGLLPLGSGEVELTTFGLKYDVTDWPSSMLGNVSSSNGVSGTNGFLVRCRKGPITINIELAFDP